MVYDWYLDCYRHRFISREDPHYSTTDDDSLAMPMRQARLTAEGLATLIERDRSEPAVRAILADHWAITEPSEEEITSIRQTTGSADLRRTLEGIVVLAEKLDKVFLPRQAIDIIKAQLQ